MTLTPKTILFSGISAIILLGLVIKLSPQKLEQESTNLQDNPTSSQSASIYETKENSGGNVTVIVKPKELTIGNPPSFEIAFDTHSVELDFDVAKSTSLTNDQGMSMGQATWDGTPSGGHHRKGILTFSQSLDTEVKQITLMLTNIVVIPARTFTWRMK